MVNPISWPQANINSQADFSPIANLGNLYNEGYKQASLADLGKKLAAGTITYQEAAGKVGETGDIASTLKFLQLAEARRQEDLALKASAEFGAKLAPMVGSTARGTGPVAAVEPEPPAPPPRVPVEPIPGVIRTNPDGSIAGNITAPSIPAPQEPPPAAPVPLPVARSTTGAPPPIAAAAPPMAPAPPLPPDQAAINPAIRNAQATAPPSMMTEGPKIEHVPMLIGALRNPYLPASDKKIAEDMLKRAWDSAKPTEKIQTLQALRDDPSLLAIEKELRKSSAPSVNMLPGEKKQDEEMGKTLADIHGGYIKDALKVPATKAVLDTAERAMASKDFSSGIVQPLTAAAQKALVAMGMTDAATAGPNELFAKLQNKAVMDAGGTASGLGPQISNNDAKIIERSTFNQSNTPEGNRMIIGFQRLMEDRKVAYVKEMNKYAKDHGGRIDINVMEHMADWAEKNPLDFDKVPGFKLDPVDAEIRRRNIERAARGEPPIR
jgi:hypothetical protein